MIFVNGGIYACMEIIELTVVVFNEVIVIISPYLLVYKVNS